MKWQKNMRVSHGCRLGMARMWIPWGSTSVPEREREAGRKEEGMYRMRKESHTVHQKRSERERGDSLDSPLGPVVLHPISPKLVEPFLPWIVTDNKMIQHGAKGY